MPLWFCVLAATVNRFGETKYQTLVKKQDASAKSCLHGVDNKLGAQKIHQHVSDDN